MGMTKRDRAERDLKDVYYTIESASKAVQSLVVARKRADDADPKKGYPGSDQAAADWLNRVRDAHLAIANLLGGDAADALLAAEWSAAKREHEER